MPIGTCKASIGPERLESREELPLLTVETEVNGDSKSTNKRGPSLVACLACRAGTIDFCSALAAQGGPIQYNFFLTVHFFNSFAPIVQQAMQAAACILLCVSVAPDCFIFDTV